MCVCVCVFLRGVGVGFFRCCGGEREGLDG